MLKNRFCKHLQPCFPFFSWSRDQPLQHALSRQPRLFCWISALSSSTIRAKGSAICMGKRREPRKPVELSVRIFGTDRDGKIFSETLTTVDVSQNGAKLQGLKARVKVDEIVGVTCGKNKVHFRVKWAGATGSAAAGQVGLLNLSPEKPFWDLPLPHGEADNFHTTATNERRKWVRVKCSISVELHVAGQPGMWGRASDLSPGGCFVEMSIPLKAESKLEVVLWLDGVKLRLAGEVVSASPGFGIGVRFTDVSPQSQELLQRHVQSLA